MNQSRGSRFSRLLWLALLLLSTSAGAQSPDDRLRGLMADPKAQAAAVEAGRKAAFFCFNCHGEDGNSKLPEVPNLAGQNPVYLLEQIGKFSAGKRRDEFMQGLMKVLSETDRVNIAVFFSNMNVKSGATGAPSTVGRQIFANRCTRCHGEQARGGDKFPRLAGQQTEYLVRSLTRYRNRSGERIDPLMLAMTAGLKDADIQALAAYLSKLN